VLVDEKVARKQLEELMGELERSASVLQHSGGGDSGELTSFDQHPADSGTNLADADREEASLEVLLAQQERVREALGRLDAGTYGRCIDCGRELPDERLEARPEADRCVDCQQRAEARR
jgi:RNA polymerase-binding transcription factor DksA